ncbi:MAG: formyltetrahydrofolate deformylase [Geminocystis sp.]|nr:formyltetrahydrofolate deformylase [Geminocystis sp.]HIK38321.1 formyltetrahydrofolate deformylase [Geminocystis sp. M7585_C2015_104]MCS7148332.1 formyltetrahydrofolate deformylase [Geminocystis sp.]MCX8078354.1 formyltetrahydrofolate deformylase [Geminocystis sp.]MDW8116080.1 formyltetrahydrofolate deformylase [Geminocystis sp.]
MVATTATLLVSCPEQKGLVAKIANFIYTNNGNIIHADHHTDLEAGLFLSRIEWELEGFRLAREEIADAFNAVATPLKAQWQLHFSDTIPRVAIWVSQQEHCLYDLLWRIQSKELKAEVVCLVSNHTKLEPIARQFGIDYYHFPINPDNKREQELKQLELINSKKIDLIILAKYMQILSADFVRKLPQKIINIHHSFLPAFVGAKPYHQAYQRGVKIIGATAHYVTEDLDAGPIIEQDVVRISHRDTVKDLIRKGKDLERVVLARAVRLHLQNRVLVYNNKTVVFA